MAVHVRVAGHDGRIYLDLADAAWRVVEIDADGVRVQEKAAVGVVRPRGMLALPEPMRGGRLSELRPFVNVRTDTGLVLYQAYLCACLRPSAERPEPRPDRSR
jgi:hypothetical protein